MVTRAEAAAKFCGAAGTTEAEWERASGGGGAPLADEEARASCKRASDKGVAETRGESASRSLGASLEQAYGMAGIADPGQRRLQQRGLRQARRRRRSAPKVVVQGSATGVARGGSMYWGAAAGARQRAGCPWPARRAIGLPGCDAPMGLGLKGGRAAVRGLTGDVGDDKPRGRRVHSRPAEHQSCGPAGASDSPNLSAIEIAFNFTESGRGRA